MRAFIPRLRTLATAHRRSAADLGRAARGTNSRPVFSAMHWRQIGPTRAGRARALAGVPSQPNVFYIGFDNGGVWRSTDYGSTWEPLFDQEPTGSIGAIAVAPSNPNVIYVGIGRRYHSARPLRRRRRLQVHRRRQDLAPPRASREPDDRDDRRRSEGSRTASSSRRSAIRTDRTPSAEFSARPTAARRSRKCCTRMNTRARTTCASIRTIRTSSMRRSGRSSRLHRRRRVRHDAVRRAGFSSPPTAARRGRN